MTSWNIRRLYRPFCYHHLKRDNICVRYVSRKHRQNSTTQFRGTLFLLPFSVGDGKKNVYEELFIKVELLECRPGSLEVSLSLNSADLAGQGYGLI